MCYHRWEIVTDTGHTKYCHCKKCGQRKIVQKPGGYQPINTDWLKHQKVMNGI